MRAFLKKSVLVALLSSTALIVSGCRDSGRGGSGMERGEPKESGYAPASGEQQGTGGGSESGQTDLESTRGSQETFEQDTMQQDTFEQGTMEQDTMQQGTMEPGTSEPGTMDQRGSMDTGGMESGQNAPPMDSSQGGGSMEGTQEPGGAMDDSAGAPASGSTGEQP